MEQPKTTAVRKGRVRRKWPACDRCHLRKTRCVVDMPGQACRHCRERSLNCNYLDTNALDLSTAPAIPPAKKHRQDGHYNTSATVSTQVSIMDPSISQINNQSESTPAESSIMMEPNMSEDIAMLEHYLSGTIVEAQAKTRLYSTISNAPGAPIVYLTVPRKRKGLKVANDPGRAQREVIEQVLNPFTAEVRDLYFEHIHPCFPILDERTFRDLWAKNNDRMSSVLLCDMYASAAVFWNCSDSLSSFPRPDLDFLWNTAVTALSDDFLAPTISTLHAALLDMVGRPVGAVTGNIVNSGRIVTLAQSLGLHRNPSSWKVTSHEKAVRIRLWWGVIIHDHWSSVGHGIPPTISTQYYDVPLPDLQLLVSSMTSEEHKSSVTTFHHLCKLTRILGNLLPLMYTIEVDLGQAWRSLRKTECSLDDWTAEVWGDISKKSQPSNDRNGASNLFFAHLSVKTLLCRLALKLTLKDPNHSPEDRQFRLSVLRRASCAVVDFVTALQPQQLYEFWLPYTSYLLVTAATVLLRCIIECGDLQTRRECVHKLLSFLNRLRLARFEYGWDLADFCLERCSEPIQKMADALSVSLQSSQVPMDPPSSPLEVSEPSEILPAQMTGSGENILDDDPLTGEIYPWEALWETLEGPWSAQVD